MKFEATDVSFIIVPDEKAKASVINKLNTIQRIGGSQKVRTSDTMDLVSKILTIEQITANF